MGGIVKPIHNMDNKLTINGDSSLGLEKPTGKLMFKFNDSEPDEAATIFNFAEVAIKLKQQVPTKGASLEIKAESTSIEFTSNDGQRFKLFIQDL